MYVRGSARHLDYKVDYTIFETSKEAQEYVRIMNELIDEINNPKTDWSNVEGGVYVKYSIDLGNGMGQGGYGEFWMYNEKLKKVVIVVESVS